MSKSAYSEDFFSLHLRHSTESAEQVIPLVLSFVNPQSVVDIGCGVGTWLNVWKKNGIKKVLGVDGDYVKKDQLLVDQSEFQAYDLSKKYNSPIKFDLVTSLEVGEHIDPSSAEVFVQTLCGLGDIILFSAAIPGQQGTHHVNEQYPDYWARLFSKQGFVAADCLRQMIWENEKVSWWYRQNILFFIKKEALINYDKLQGKTTEHVVPMVHPELLAFTTSQVNYLKKSLGNPVRTLVYYIKRMIGRN